LTIQTILLYPSGAVWTDDVGNVSRLDPSGAVQVDAEHPSRNRKVVGSNLCWQARQRWIMVRLRRQWRVGVSLGAEDRA
jgi:hypothetical protein